MNKGCHTCMIKHTMHVQSLHCSTYLTWLDMCIYLQVLISSGLNSDILLYMLSDQV